MKDITQLLKEKILVLDGAMGTIIQSYKLSENDYRGNQFAKHPLMLKGNNDLLSITQPKIIADIHEKYLLAGADIIETNTFNANRISQADYNMQDHVYDINFEAAKIAKTTALKFSDKKKPRFVAGSIGPTNKTASMSPKVEDPGYREVNFDILAEAYYEQAKALVEGGADLLLVETVFDTLNAKAALYAINNLCDNLKLKIPVMVSVTITDVTGRTLSGQTLKAFYTSIKHVNLLSFGLNCAFGADQLSPFIKELANYSKFFLSAHPNAGLPNQLGEYDQSAKIMADIIEPLLKDGLLNIIGGCCGTTPLHIEAIANIAEKYKPRLIPNIKLQTSLSGLEVLNIYDHSNFINIGERTNMAGSKKFARLIREEKYEEAVSVAREQINGGAQIIDICMDDPLIDSVHAMKRFLNLIASEPDIARVPFMLDSSDWKVIEAGLKCVQGKCIVNSISLKDGEALFLKKAAMVKKFGAALIVMLFDEKGQAVSYERKQEIAARSYTILTEKAGIEPEDIIIDPNILTVATGMKEHNNYAVNYIRACKWIKQNLKGVKISGGVSNLSFSFRGNSTVREALHAVFLYHAIKEGMDMGIVNPELLVNYEEIPSDLLQLAKDVVLNKRNDATERLINYAESVKKDKDQKQIRIKWRELPVEQRIMHSVVKGISEYIENDVSACIDRYPSAINIIEGPLMDAMNKTGELFGSGKMFLPQVIKSARVMKQAVAFLQPFIESETENSTQKQTRKRIVLATVKGDVHDIGKNITALVLSCNNYEIIDLGVTVDASRIIETAISAKADAVGLSGLITPSLEEMRFVAQEMKAKKLNIPLLIGGATTSKIHTALKLSPEVDFPVIHVADASKSVHVTSQLFSNRKYDFIDSIIKENNKLREAHLNKNKHYISIEQARKNALKINWDKAIYKTPEFTGEKLWNSFPLNNLTKLIDWTFFFYSMDLNGKYPDILADPVKGPEATRLFEDAQEILQNIIDNELIRAQAVLGFYPANSQVDDIIVWKDEKRKQSITVFYNLRNQEEKSDIPNLCLSDFIAPAGYQDYIGCFAVTAGIGVHELIQYYKEKKDDYKAVIVSLLADRMAEALAEYLHYKVRTKYWGYSPNEDFNPLNILKQKYQGIRPAPGYPACPDHALKESLFELMSVTNNTEINLTETYSMIPVASVCGFYFSHPQAKYFNVGKVSKDQVIDLSKRTKRSLANAEKYFPTNLNYK